MAGLNKTFSLLRTATFGVATLFAVLVLIMATLVLNFTVVNFSAYFIYSALAVATAILTFATLPFILLVSLNRKGAFTSMAVVEIVWTFVLWVLWLSTGATAADTLFINSCGDFLSAKTRSACQETQALAAFSFLNWIFLMAYNIFLLVITIRSNVRGNTGIWTSDVTTADFAAPGAAPAVPPAQTSEHKVDPSYASQYATTPVLAPTPQPTVHTTSPSTPSYPQV